MLGRLRHTSQICPMLPDASLTPTTFGIVARRASVLGSTFTPVRPARCRRSTAARRRPRSRCSAGKPLGRRLVVAWRDRENSLRTGLPHPLPDVDDLARVVAARPCEDRHLPAASCTTSSTTRTRSSSLSVGLSPVVPHGTRK